MTKHVFTLHVLAYYFMFDFERIAKHLDRDFCYEL